MTGPDWVGTEGVRLDQVGQKAWVGGLDRIRPDGFGLQWSNSEGTVHFRVEIQQEVLSSQKQQQKQYVICPLASCYS